MTDPVHCPECGSPKPSTFEFCSDRCEVLALRRQVAAIETVTAERIAAYLRRVVDPDEAPIALLLCELADDIEEGEWKKLAALPGG